jgi:hypothetical protein
VSLYRRLLPVVCVVLAAAVLASALAQAEPIDVTGAWGISATPNISDWHLTAYGSGRSSLQASWTGGPGHGQLHGTFHGTLTGTNVYSGPMQVAEMSVRATGTMTFTILSKSRIVVTYSQSNGVHGTINLVRHVSETPVKITISFHANNLLTNAPMDGGRCPGHVAARITGSIEAQITERGDMQGGGDVADTPHLAKCRVPVIKIAVDHIALHVLTPGRAVQATLSVHIDGSGTHQPGECAVGTAGTIVATYDDTSVAANSSRNDRLQLGPWSGMCNAHNQTISNNITSITAGSSSSTWVNVWIGCLGGPGTGYSPRNCE